MSLFSGACLPSEVVDGTVERCYRHIVETGLMLLGHASVLNKYWSKAFQTVVFLINRMPIVVLNS